MERCSISPASVAKLTKRDNITTGGLLGRCEGLDLGLWERPHNSDFNPLEFDGVRKQAGANAFTMSPKKRIEATDAIGIVSKAGRF